MRAISLRHGAVTALLAAVAAVLWPSPALALDIPIYANHDYQGHLARNLGTPALAHDALRLGDVAVGACVLKGTGVNAPTFICGIAGTDYQLPMTAADGSILFPTASSLRLRDVTGLSVMGRPGSSAGPAQDITATADNQVLQRLAGTVQFHTLDFSQLTGTVGSGVLAGTPYTVPYFGAGGALAENATALGYDPTNVRLGSRVSSGLPLYQLHLVDEAAAADRGIDLGEFSSTDNGPVLTLDKASGTYAAPSAVANTSAGGRVSYRQYTGTQWLETARSGVHVRPGATITSTSVPTQWYVSGSSIGNVDPYAGSGLPTGLLVEGVNAKVGYNPITPGAVGTSTGGLLSVYGQTQTTSLIAGPGTAFSNTKLMVTADAGVNNAQAAIRNTNVSATGFSQLSFSNDSGSTSAADLVFTSSTYADSYGWGPNAFAIWNAAPSGPIILGGNPGTLPVPQALRIDSDSRVSFQDSAAAVSASGFSALRSNAGHLQYSQTGGAWKSFDSFLTDPGANGVVVRTASGTTVNRSLTNTDGTIVFTFPDGVAGNPVINTAGLAPTSRTFTGTAPISFNGDHAAHTLASNMVAALDANGVTYPFLQQGVALSIPGRALNSAGNWADIVAAAGSGCVFRESGSTLGCGNITEGSVTNLAADLAGKQPTGNYITALNGDGTATGPGSVSFTLHNIPNLTTMAGSVLATEVTGTATPAGGAVNIHAESSTDTLWVTDSAGRVTTTARPGSAGAHNFLTGMGSNGTFTFAQPSYNDLSGTVPAITALHGDGSATGPGNAAFTLSNIPSATTQAGFINATGIATPATPATGHGNVYYDATSQNLGVITEAGTYKHGIQTDTGATNQFVTGITDTGFILKARPTTANIQGPSGTGDQCLHFDNSGNVSGTGAPCGSGSGSVISVTASSPLASSGGTSPNITLSNSGVTPGTYVTPTLTVDASGRVTAASFTNTYQLAESDGTTIAAESTLNFQAPLHAADSGGSPFRTNVSFVPPTGILAGSGSALTTVIVDSPLSYSGGHLSVTIPPQATTTFAFTIGGPNFDVSLPSGGISPSPDFWLRPMAYALSTTSPGFEAYQQIWEYNAGDSFGNVDLFAYVYQCAITVSAGAQDDLVFEVTKNGARTGRHFTASCPVAGQVNTQYVTFGALSLTSTDRVGVEVYDTGAGSYSSGALRADVTLRLRP